MSCNFSTSSYKGCQQSYNQTMFSIYLEIYSQTFFQQKFHKIRLSRIGWSTYNTTKWMLKSEFKFGYIQRAPVHHLIRSHKEAWWNRAKAYVYYTPPLKLLTTDWVIWPIAADSRHSKEVFGKMFTDAFVELKYNFVLGREMSVSRNVFMYLSWISLVVTNKN